MPATSECVIEVSETDFEQSVIARSAKMPVIVDFWAPWCGPCRALAPVLEKLAVEYGGQFVLAKVNSDENQALSARFGIRGIPNVKAFVNGVVVDEFSGAMPESSVRAFLDRVIPSPAEKLRRQAMADYMSNRDGQQALAALARAIELDPRSDEARLDSAELLIELGRHMEGQAQLDAVSALGKLGDRAIRLAAGLHFAAANMAGGDLASLEARVANNSDDLEARLGIANHQVAAREYAAALEQLLEIVRRNRAYQDDIARKTMLQVFSLLGNEGDLVRDYRRKLASTMH